MLPYKLITYQIISKSRRLYFKTSKLFPSSETLVHILKCFHSSAGHCISKFCNLIKTFRPIFAHSQTFWFSPWPYFETFKIFLNSLSLDPYSQNFSKSSRPYFSRTLKFFSSLSKFYSSPKDYIFSKFPRPVAFFIIIFFFKFLTPYFLERFPSSLHFVSCYQIISKFLTP
jgi:hypothetical protein